MEHKDPTSLENVIAGGLLADAYKLLKLHNQIAGINYSEELPRKIHALDNNIKRAIATLEPNLRKSIMEIIQHKHDHPKDYIKHPGSTATYDIDTLQTLCYIILSYNECIPENDDDFSM